MYVKEPKIIVSTKDCTKYPHSVKPAPTLRCPRHQRVKLKSEIAFRIASAIDLLNSIQHWISQPTFITNGTVSYKYVSYLGIV